MRVLVVGGTGTVGNAAVAVLRGRGVTVRCMTRSPDKLVCLTPEIECRLGDLNDPSSLPACFEDCDAVFMVTALSPNETQQGLNGVKAAVDARAKKIVYMSVFDAPGTDHIPHFASKRPVEQAVIASGIPFAILQPYSFYQNDNMQRQAIQEHGLFIEPFGEKGSSRIDVRDIADAAANALLGSDVDGETHPLAGSRVLTGSEMAELYARQMGTPIRSIGDDLDAWENIVSSHMPTWLVHDLRVMYEHFLDRGSRATEEEVRNSAEIVGHPQRDYATFVEETVRHWTS